MIRKITGTVVVVMMCMWALSGCRTMQGAGEDIQSGGKALERAAE